MLENFIVILHYKLMLKFRRLCLENKFTLKIAYSSKNVIFRKFKTKFAVSVTLTFPKNVLQTNVVTISPLFCQDLKKKNQKLFHCNLIFYMYEL